MRKLENTTLLGNDDALLSGLQPNALYMYIPSSLCCVQSERGMQVHCVGGQRGGRHHSVVVSMYRPNDDALFHRIA